MEHVEYIGVPPALLPAGGPAAAYLLDDLIQMAVDETQLDERMFGGFMCVSDEILAELTPRAAPRAVPWGRVRIDPIYDATVDRIVPTITASGVYIPVPGHLLREDLRRYLEVVGTDLTRYYDPPTIGR